MTPMRNILVICTDDHAQWALGSYGNRELRTPTFDYLSNTGVQMDNAFTPIPVCSPARACLLTGRLPSQHGIHDYLDGDPEFNRREWLRDELTLPQILSKSGYQTGLSGKWHLGNDFRPHEGFDYWFSLGDDYPIPHSGDFRFCDNGEIAQMSGYKSHIITDRAIEFLRRRDRERPFFLFVGYVATHHPWAGHAERLVSGYRRCTFDDIPKDSSYPFGRQVLESTFDTRNNRREALAQYYASVSELDEAVGRLIDEIESNDMRSDTLVVYTSDHGLCCSHHGIWGKGNGTLPLNMVEEAIRVPMIFNQPGVVFGQQHRREFVDHLDLFQTLLDYTGVSVSDSQTRRYPGRSFLPLLQNSDSFSDWRTEQFGEYGNVRMIRTETHKLVLRYPSGPAELFDLQSDPREEHSLYHDPSCQDIVRALSGRIEEHFKTYEDPIKSGLRVRELPPHNRSEAWRVDKV